jgi:hypothetical protein
VHGIGEVLATKRGVVWNRRLSSGRHPLQMMAAGMAGMAIGLSAAIVGPALGVQNSLMFAGSTTDLPEEAAPKKPEISPTLPTGASSSTSSLESSPPSNPVQPSKFSKPDPVVVVTPSPAVSLPPVLEVAAPAPEIVTNAPKVAAPAPQASSESAPITSEAAIVQQPSATQEVGTVTITQVLPGNGVGEAVLRWYLVPGGTEYRVYKTGTIRPTWRLFYIYPPSITSITVFDKPGSIAIYKIMAVVNGKEKFLGEAIYEPIN